MNHCPASMDCEKNYEKTHIWTWEELNLVCAPELELLRFHFFLKCLLWFWFFFPWTASFGFLFILNLFEEECYNCCCQTGRLLNIIQKYLYIQLSQKPENKTILVKYFHTYLLSWSKTKKKHEKCNRAQNFKYRPNVIWILWSVDQKKPSRIKNKLQR